MWSWSEMLVTTLFSLRTFLGRNTKELAFWPGRLFQGTERAWEILINHNMHELYDRANQAYTLSLFNGERRLGCRAVCQPLLIPISISISPISAHYFLSASKTQRRRRLPTPTTEMNLRLPKNWSLLKISHTLCFLCQQTYFLRAVVWLKSQSTFLSFPIASNSPAVSWSLSWVVGCWLWCSGGNSRPVYTPSRVREEERVHNKGSGECKTEFHSRLILLISTLPFQKTSWTRTNRETWGNCTAESFYNPSSRTVTFQCLLCCNAKVRAPEIGHNCKYPAGTLLEPWLGNWDRLWFSPVVPIPSCPAVRIFWILFSIYFQIGFVISQFSRLDSAGQLHFHSHGLVFWSAVRLFCLRKWQEWRRRNQSNWQREKCSRSTLKSGRGKSIAFTVQ